MAEFQIRRRRTTLLDQLSLMEPNNLRDLIQVRDDDDASGAGSHSDGIVTLASILESEKHEGRTLLDIIHEEDEVRAVTLEPGGPIATPPDVEEEQAVRVSLMTLLALTDVEGGEDPVESASGSDGGVAVVAMAEEDGGEEDLKTVSVAVGDERMVCCVCMVRRKGAAFIPCGHTFCRVCSRELWTCRGSCPLCNAIILDILDIF
ncbi:uncharacterized protein LOC110038542 [Phalaenopsis equestris]|uniref:uncharacterized protein LOC110038542 n=1 Tax=Phalaenopsis equestris TaxID=78828 RepID=UPI0009E3F36E|nr:uncharacterized protein LOC110038542 [Phalaenopsis equestris]